MTKQSRISFAIALAGAIAACGGDPEPLDQCYEPTLSVAVCDSSNNFSIESTNPLFPMVVGSKTVIEGDDEGEFVRVELTVLDETEEVDGVTTRVIEAREIVDDELYEIARDFYAVADDGTICYFGEDVEFYEDGMVVNQEGTWRAGVDGAVAGIIMPGSPAAGQRFFQEYAPGEAIDMARVDAVDLTVTLAGTEYQGVVRMMDSNPLDGQPGCDEEEEKLWVPGIGLASDTTKVLVSFTPGDAPTSR